MDNQMKRTGLNFVRQPADGACAGFRQHYHLCEKQPGQNVESEHLHNADPTTSVLAVYRYQHGMDFTMQLLMEVRRFYHPEYLIGKIFARPDEKELESFFPPRR